MPHQTTGQGRDCALPHGKPPAASLEEGQHPCVSTAHPQHAPTLLHCSGCCRTQSSAWLCICLAWLWVICLQQLCDRVCAHRRAQAGVLNVADKSRCARTMWPVASCLCTTLARPGTTSTDCRNPHWWGHIALTYLDQKNSQAGRVQSWTKNTSVIKKIHPQHEILGGPDLFAP